MKNFIKGLKEVKGGGDIQAAQATIERCFPYHIAALTENTTIETIEQLAISRLQNIQERFKDDEKFLQFKNCNEANKHWLKQYQRDFEKYEKLLDACYCIKWTAEHQQRTIAEIMNDYRNTRKIRQEDFTILRNSRCFNTNELENILLGLPIGFGTYCNNEYKIKA